MLQLLFFLCQAHSVHQSGSLSASLTAFPSLVSHCTVSYTRSFSLLVWCGSSLFFHWFMHRLHKLLHSKRAADLTTRPICRAFPTLRLCRPTPTHTHHSDTLRLFSFCRLIPAYRLTHACLIDTTLPQRQLPFDSLLLSGSKPSPTSLLLRLILRR